MTHSAPRLIIAAIIGLFSFAWGQPAPENVGAEKFSMSF
jgi:hypothetical protein